MPASNVFIYCWFFKQVIAAYIKDIEERADKKCEHYFSLCIARNTLKLYNTNWNPREPKTKKEIIKESNNYVLNRLKKVSLAVHSFWKFEESKTAESYTWWAFLFSRERHRLYRISWSLHRADNSFRCPCLLSSRVISLPHFIREVMPVSNALLSVGKVNLRIGPLTWKL